MSREPLPSGMVVVVVVDVVDDVVVDVVVEVVLDDVTEVVDESSDVVLVSASSSLQAPSTRARTRTTVRNLRMSP